MHERVNILDISASKHKPEPIFFSEASATFTRAVGVTLDNKRIDFSVFSDTNVFGSFVKEFDEQDFAANIDFFISELKAMVAAEMDGEMIIWVLIGHIKFYLNKLRSDVKQGTENTWRKSYLLWLTDELEKRITKQLRDRLESI